MSPLVFTLHPTGSQNTPDVIFSHIHHILHHNPINLSTTNNNYNYYSHNLNKYFKFAESNLKITN